MKTKPSKQPKQSVPVKMKDIKPKKDARGGRTGSQFTGGVRVASADVGGDN